MKIVRVFPLLLLLILIVSACSGENASTTSTTSTTSTSGDKQADAKADEIKTITIGMGTDMLTFDPHNHQTTATETIHINMYNYLVKNNNGEITPDLATSWELIDDKTWEFKLRDDVKFHNGDPFTSEDVKFSLERVAKDDSLREHPNYKQIKEVEIIDEYTVRIITHEIDPVLLNRVSRLGSGMIPSKYIEEKGFDEFLKNPVGTGPFKFVEWKKDDRVVLERNDDYFNGVTTEWDRVVFRAILESSTRVGELLTGGIDIATEVPPIDWDRINNNNGTSVTQGPVNRTMMLFLRATEGYATSDVRVRQAIDYAIDDNTIIQSILGGGGKATLTRLNPGNFGFNESLFDRSNYDPEKARELLKEAGYEDGVEIVIHSPSGRYFQDKETVEMIGGMLAQVGITAKLEFMEWGTFVDLRTAKQHKDAYFIALGNSLFDAAQALDYYHSERSSTINDYSNPEVDALLDAADKNLNTEEREKQYQKVQEIVAEEVPIIPLFQIYSFTGVNDRINYEPRIDEMILIENITLK
ncbi:peptide ABC transporter substrate-binding protein [Ureibacillus manganicus DSM 26584]|uniref:Peptide ABC transporter substrate-binding protein n=2 Tax=Ureibacillus TaxID=160795 RepID=A0A0A3I1M1_9BACL|nr:peptide ABC transporter substrate-binding protein [Ureibacillus manganicus DSM 26584]